MVRNVLPAIGHVPPSRITHGDVKATVQASAYDDELMDERPFRRRITTPQRRKPQRAPRTAQEAIAALGAMRGRPLETYLILGLSGLRIESLGISPADIVSQATYDLVTGTEVRTLALVVRRKYTDADGPVDEAKNEVSVRERPAIVAGRDRLLAIVAVTRSTRGGGRSSRRWVCASSRRTCSSTCPRC